MEAVQRGMHVISTRFNVPLAGFRLAVAAGTSARCGHVAGGDTVRDRFLVVREMLDDSRSADSVRWGIGVACRFVLRGKGWVLPVASRCFPVALAYPGVVDSNGVACTP